MSRHYSLTGMSSVLTETQHTKVSFLGSPFLNVFPEVSTSEHENCKLACKEYICLKNNLF